MWGTGLGDEVRERQRLWLVELCCAWLGGRRAPAHCASPHPFPPATLPSLLTTAFLQTQHTHSQGVVKVSESDRRLEVLPRTAVARTAYCTPGDRPLTWHVVVVGGGCGGAPHSLVKQSPEGLVGQNCRA